MDSNRPNIYGNCTIYHTKNTDDTNSYDFMVDGIGSIYIHFRYSKVNTTDREDKNRGDP